MIGDLKLLVGDLVLVGVLGLAALLYCSNFGELAGGGDCTGITFDVVAGEFLILFSLSSGSLSLVELSFLALEELAEVRFVFLASFLSKAVRRPRSRMFSTGSQVLS